MGSLNELAQEYLSNAENLKLQIAKLEASLPKASDTERAYETAWKLRILKDMLSEQMTAYYQLTNYYKNKE